MGKYYCMLCNKNFTSYDKFMLHDLNKEGKKLYKKKKSFQSKNTQNKIIKIQNQYGFGIKGFYK